MSKHLATTAVRRRWCVCATYAGEQEASWPRRAREKARARARPKSTYSYLALDGGGESQGLELAILKLVISSSERSRHFPLAALREAIEPIRPADFHAALAQLEQQGILVRHEDFAELAPSAQHLIDLGLIPRV